MHLGHVLKFAHDRGATSLAHVETILRQHGLRLNEVLFNHPQLEALIFNAGTQVGPSTSDPAAAAAPGELDYDRLAEAIVNRLAKGAEKVTAKLVPSVTSVIGTFLELSGGGHGNFIEKLMAEQHAEEERLKTEDEARAAAAGSPPAPAPNNVVQLPTAAPAEPPAASPDPSAG